MSDVTVHTYLPRQRYLVNTAISRKYVSFVWLAHTKDTSRAHHRHKINSKIEYNSKKVYIIN